MEHFSGSSVEDIEGLDSELVLVLDVVEKGVLEELGVVVDVEVEDIVLPEDEVVVLEDEVEDVVVLEDEVEDVVVLEDEVGDVVVLEDEVGDVVVLEDEVVDVVVLEDEVGDVVVPEDEVVVPEDEVGNVVVPEDEIVVPEDEVEDVVVPEDEVVAPEDEVEDVVVPEDEVVVPEDKVGDVVVPEDEAADVVDFVSVSELMLVAGNVAVNIAEGLLLVVWNVVVSEVEAAVVDSKVTVVAFEAMETVSSAPVIISLADGSVKSPFEIAADATKLAQRIQMITLSCIHLIRIFIVTCKIEFKGSYNFTYNN